MEVKSHNGGSGLYNGYKTNGNKGGGEMSEEMEEASVKSGLSFWDDRHPSVVLHSLNMMRKNRTFCDVVLHVGKSELYGHRAVLASVSPHLLEMFSTDDENGIRESIISYKLNGAFEKPALEKLIDYAYTAKLELSPQEVRSVFVAAIQLKMERVAKECAAYLVHNLSVDTCVETRSLPGIVRDRAFLSRVDSFIASNFEEVRQSPSLLALPCVKIEVLSRSLKEMTMIGCESLCRLALDWVKRTFGESSNLVEKTHLLYLAMDNSLQDCTELPAGDASDTEIVQDYKRLSKSTSQPNKKGSRRCQPAAKPRVIIYSRDIQDSTEQEREVDWKLVASTKVRDHAFLGLVAMQGKLGTLSVMLRLNTPKSSTTPGGSSSITISSAPGSIDGGDPGAYSAFGTEKKDVSVTSWSARSSADGSDADEAMARATGSSIDGGDFLPEDDDEECPPTYCDLANMANFKCGAGCANLNDNLLVCGGYDRAECLRSVELYSPESNAWASLAPMLEARGRFNIAVVEGQVYAVGGCNGTTELATVERYSAPSRKWERIASLPMARSNTGVCSLSGMIYCIGGWNGQVGIKQCDVFDPSTGKWSSIAPLNTGRYQAGVCSMNDQVWVVGGCDGWNCLNSVEVYTPPQDDSSNNIESSEGEKKPNITLPKEGWAKSKRMITARRGCGVAVFNGKLYAVGGSDGTQSLATTEIYDPVEKAWSPGPSMTTPRSNVGVAVIGSRLYAVGGFSGKTFLNSIEYLDETTNEWTTFGPKISAPPATILASVAPEEVTTATTTTSANVKTTMSTKMTNGTDSNSETTGSRS